MSSRFSPHKKSNSGGNCYPRQWRCRNAPLVVENTWNNTSVLNKTSTTQYLRCNRTDLVVLNAVRYTKHSVTSAYIEGRLTENSHYLFRKNLHLKNLTDSSNFPCEVRKIIFTSRAEAVNPIVVICLFYCFFFWENDNIGSLYNEKLVKSFITYLHSFILEDCVLLQLC